MTYFSYNLRWQVFAFSGEFVNKTIAVMHFSEKKAFWLTKIESFTITFWLFYPENISEALKTKCPNWSKLHNSS